MSRESYPSLVKNQRIWMYWHDGWTNNSVVVQSARQSWLLCTQQNSSSSYFNVIFLDQLNIIEYIEQEVVLIRQMDVRNTNKLGMAHLADLIRLSLLNKHGGIWVDATVFCNKPPTQWLVPIIEKNNFFAFYKPAGGSRMMLSNWFLYSTPSHYIVSTWLSKALEYIKTDPPTHLKKNYFWMHGLFGEIYRSDNKFKLLWDNTTKWSADGPHTLQKSKNMTNSLTPEMKQTLDESEIPVYKLTWKMNQTLIQPGTMLFYLFHSHGIVNGTLNNSNLFTWHHTAVNTTVPSTNRSDIRVVKKSVRDHKYRHSRSLIQNRWELDSSLFSVVNGDSISAGLRVAILCKYLFNDSQVEENACYITLVFMMLCVIIICIFVRK